MSFIQIVDDEDPIEWSPETEDGAVSDAVFTLRILSDATKRALRKAHTSFVFRHGERREEIDREAIGTALLDYAILKWSGVTNVRTGEALECTSERKAKLPERIKVDIVRICAGNDVDRLSGGTDPNRSSPTTSTGSATTSPS